MYPVYDPQTFHNDGTPKRKYEIEDKAAKKLALRVTLSLMMISVFALIKYVLFGTDVARSLNQDAAQRDDHSQRAPVSDDSDVVATEELNANASADELEETNGLAGDSKLDRLSGSGPLSAGPIDDAHDPVRSKGGSDVQPKLSSANDNETLYGARPGTVVTAFSSGEGGGSGGGSESTRSGNSGSGNSGSGSSGGGGSGSGGSGGDLDVGDNVDDDDDDDDGGIGPGGLNRLPVVAGPVILPGMLANSSIVIALADLLRHAHDLDGDALSVTTLTASSGTVQALAGGGGWIYTSAPNDTSSVTFTYVISDGHGGTAQLALLDLIEPDDGIIKGTDGDDRIVGTPGRDVIDAKAGHDVVVGRGGDDVIYGGDGNDRILGEDGDDLIYAGDGHDVVFGGGGSDVIFAGRGNDIVFGEAGRDTIYGEDGDDTLSGGADGDRIFGDAGNDQLLGDGGNDLVDGGVGDDSVDGGGENDLLIGGAGRDIIFGRSGDDVAIATTGDGNDHYDGGEGTDTYDTSATHTAIIVNLETGVAVSLDTGTDTIVRIENVVAGAGDDTIVGNGEDNVLTGGAGLDAIDAGGGNDRVVATTSDGDDDYDGGDGQDIYDISATDADALIDLLSGIAESGDIGRDTLAQFEDLIGGSGNDTFIAGLETNVFTGGDGEDIFVFLSAATTGSGSGSRDRIMDFVIGDRIDMRQMGEDVYEQMQDTFADPVMRRFVMISSGDPFEKPGQMRFKYDPFNDGEITILEGNTDGDSDPDFQIELAGRYELRSEDFST